MARPQFEALAAEGGNRSWQSYRRGRLFGETAAPLLAFMPGSFIAVAGLVLTSMTSVLAFAQNEPSETARTEVDAKYPYCIVDVENLEARSLATAIETFNQQSMESPIGRFQPAVTEDETLDAIRAFSMQPHLPVNVKATLDRIAQTKQLPATAYFRRFTRYDDGQRMNRVWWVRLVITSDEPPVYGVPVRTKEISWRSYTQMERQQNAARGVMLLNRFSSYFEVEPNILLKAEFPKDAQKRLIADTKAAIEGDSAALARAFEWNGVSDSTREFATSELEQMRQANIESIKIRPRNFKAPMVHWSAYQHYQPNLPIVGYMDIDYRDASDQSQPLRTLSLEIGKLGDELRMVHYIKDGKPKLPKELVKGLSIRGQIEPLADGTYLLTNIITNPGSLLSAHLANEEVWKRSPSLQF
ncbi:hypothetical protein [Novipirellula artificiosorum]|uniref:Uncharacterized protein n=1 Tax=Novipirellula artificiosorum TaxID=2528016 RepID=A0A5C6E0F9_9BACT|nr:hypothetical protein [Novipirellula artificiosorum]TWU42372.1 hypothetical protein Poly41_06690 [Novipirellula artificiosorum]